MSDPRDTRGFRNRNPGNIDYNPANRWQGQVGIEPTPRGGGRPRFAVFESHEFGIRALAMLLTTYQDRHGLRTIKAIINRWAPPNENATRSYIDHVSKLTGFNADQVLDLHLYSQMRPLVVAIITHELGGQPYDDATIDRGLELAGLPKPVETMREAATTRTGRGAIAAASATTIAATIVQVAPAVSGLQGLDWRVGVAVVIAAAVAVVAWVLTKRKDS